MPPVTLLKYILIFSIVVLTSFGGWLVFVGDGFEIAAGFFMILAAIDLAFTLRGKPLFKPGPIAKLGHKNLSDKDGYL